MNDSDKAGFKELMTGLTAYYKTFNPKLEPLTTMALRIYFNALKNYTLEQIMDAAGNHATDPKQGMFFPAAANLVKYLEGNEITADMIVAAAKLADTPLGCLAAIHIGSWDLSHQDAFYLRQRATECLQLMPKWRHRALIGEYTDHEISIMIKHNVDPCGPIAFGMAAPANVGRLLERQEQIKATRRHQEVLAAPYAPSGEIKNQDALGIKAITDKLRLTND